MVPGTRQFRRRRLKEANACSERQADFEGHSGQGLFMVGGGCGVGVLCRVPMSLSFVACIELPASFEIFASGVRSLGEWRTSIVYIGCSGEWRGLKMLR